jgi:hypothetical protein
MTTKQFNEKYKEYLEEGHYGLDISYPAVVKYLDTMFEGLVKIPGFKYSQIKLKFNMCRFYTNLHEIAGTLGGNIDHMIEKEINFLVRVEDEVYKRLIEENKLSKQKGE